MKIQPQPIPPDDSFRNSKTAPLGIQIRSLVIIKNKVI